MESLQYIGKTELARHTRQVIRDAQRGYTVVVENHGQAEVAIIDVIDYYLLCAIAHYHSYPKPVAPVPNHLAQLAQSAKTVQASYNIGLGHYLQGNLSLSQLAQVWGVTEMALNGRLTRLNILPPPDRTPALQEVDSALGWPANFFADTFGSLPDMPLVPDFEGVYEERDAFE